MKKLLLIICAVFLVCRVPACAEDISVFQNAATQALCVALTNDCALDVFNPDGNTFNESKFHDAKYRGEYYVELLRDGTWTKLSDNKLHVEDIYLINKSYNQAVKVRCDVEYTGGKFIFTGEQVKAMPKYIDSDSPSKTTGWMPIDPYEYDQPYFIVPNKMLTAELPKLPNNRKITFDADRFIVYTGKAQRVNCVVESLAEDAPKQTVLEWSSSDESIVTVNAGGTLTGKNAGTAIITVCAKDDASIAANVEVEVRIPVQSVAINEKNVTLLVGAGLDSNQTKLTFAVKPANAFFQTGTWSSSKEDIVTVDADGTIHGLSAGNATITFTSDDPNGLKKAQVMVKVNQAVEKINLNQETINVPVSRNAALRATVEPANAVNKKVVWSSADESVATVNASGQVTGKACGTTTITATADDGSSVSAACIVTVVQPVKKIALSEKNISLAPETNWQLTASTEPENATIKDIIWTSSNEKVAIVDENGLVKGVGKGSANISAVAADGSGVKASVSVKVQEYDLVFTTKQPQQITYTYKSGRSHITGSVKNGNVKIPDIDTYVFAMIVGGPAQESVTVTPIHPGTDVITIKVNSKKTKYTVFVAQETFPDDTGE